MMGFAKLLALPVLLFLGTLLDVASLDDSDAPPATQPDAASGNLLDDFDPVV